MLWALVRGETDPIKLASLAKRDSKRRCRNCAARCRDGLTVNQRFVLGELLQRWEELEKADGRVTREIDKYLKCALSWPAFGNSSTASPGIGPRVAEVVVAEIGVQMEAVFASDAHLASWGRYLSGQQRQRR